jgi:hypothetical protein
VWTGAPEADATAAAVRVATAEAVSEAVAWTGAPEAHKGSAAEATHREATCCLPSGIFHP